MKHQGQKFFYDHDNDVFYLVNFNEERYMQIAEKGSIYYSLCRRLYCSRWDFVDKYFPEILTFKKVDRLEQIDGCED